MNKKKLLITGLFLLLPFVSLAKESDDVIGTNAKKDDATILEVVNKDNKKEELRKQFVDVVGAYSAIVNSFKRLSQRILEREDILISQGDMSEGVRVKIDAKREVLNNQLADMDEKIDNTLTKSAETVLESDRPARLLRDFKKEANKIKIEILSARKLVIEIINMIKDGSNERGA